MAEQNCLRILASTNDLYGTGRQDLSDCALRSVAGESAIDALFEVQTFYERMFTAQGYKITYLSFVIDHDGPYIHPEFDSDYWRSVEGPRHFSHQPEKKR